MLVHSLKNIEFLIKNADMEDNFSGVVECCDSCNLSFEPWNTRLYEVLYQGSKIHDQNKITLCYVCSKIAKYAEQLINNIQDNSVIKLDNHKNKRPIKNLSILHLGTLQLLDNDSTVTSYSVISAKDGKILKECGKIKVKIEDNLYEHGLGDDAVLHVEETGGTVIKQEYMNEEDNIPQRDLIIEDINIIEVKKRDRNTSGSEPGKSIETDLVEETSNKEKQITFATVHLTTEQYMQEKTDRSKTDRYLNSQYLCTDCVIGFFYKNDYLKHMKKHSESAGQYECDLCKQRWNTKNKLRNHMKKHLIRYKCTQCNLLRNQPLTIRGHLYSVHGIGNLPKIKCDECSMVFNMIQSLRNHKSLKHRPQNKETCIYCQKMYSSLRTLKHHIILKHPNELSSEQEEKSYVCQECGTAFRTAALLKTHGLKHSVRKNYYCVECDRVFKSELALRNHLKATSIHLRYSELRFACTQCEKRFATKRSLEIHTNSIHLKIKPYQCDQCSKTYGSIWSLNKHKKITHEGYKLPRKYQCEICDKAFAHKRILQDHTRTHTGERPFQCDKCEATFTHTGTLATHNKLVHLKLKRNRKTK